MNIYLVVKSAFQTYVRGDLIADLDKIENILKSSLAHHVTKVSRSADPGSKS